MVFISRLMLDSYSDFALAFFDTTALIGFLVDYLVMPLFPYFDAPFIPVSSLLFIEDHPDVLAGS